MRKTTFFKTMLVAIAIVAGSMSAQAQESIIYSTGFESSQSFIAGTVYNNTTVLKTGVTGQQWGTVFGGPSATSALVGIQSMQMRWYTNSATTLGYTFTNFDLHNVTKVIFKAANTTGINVIASYSTNGGITYTGNQTFVLSTVSAPYTFNVSATGEFANVRIKLAISLASPAPTSTSRLYLDDISVYGITGTTATDAATPTFSSGTGNYLTPQSISISSATSGAAIYYTTDGTTPDNTKTLYSDPVSVNATTTIKAIAYATGLNVSPVASAIYTFPVEAANIAALRAGTTGTVIYRLTGETILTYQTTDYGKAKYIQDATGAILIYDSGSKITSTYNINDGLSGITGSLSVYNGMLELIPATDPGIATSTNNSPEPIQITPDELGNYEGQLIKVIGVNIEAGTFTASTNCVFNEGALSGLIRSAYSDLDYIGTAIPTTKQDITGVVLNYSTTQTVLVPRSLADFVPTVTTDMLNTENSDEISGSKSTVTLHAKAGEIVDIYTITGQKIASMLTAEGLNIIPVAAHGVVIVKAGNRIAKVIL